MTGGGSFNEFVGDMSRDSNLPVPEDYSLLETFAQQCYPFQVPWAAPAYDHSTVIKSLESNDLGECVRRSALTVIRSTMNHAFITTDTGHMVKSLSGVREGDVLCILFGSRKPAVLRPCVVGDLGKEVYELNAFAWAHGLMDGEFVKDGKFRRQMFTPR